MSQPSGTQKRLCPYCGQMYTKTNWMRRYNGGHDKDGRPLRDTHLIACYRKAASQSPANQGADMTATPEPREPSRSQLKREAARRGEPMPTHDPPRQPEPRGKMLPDGDNFWIRKDGDFRIVTGELSHSCRDCFFGWKGMEPVQGLIDQLPSGGWLPASPPLSDGDERQRDLDLSEFTDSGMTTWLWQQFQRIREAKPELSIEDAFRKVVRFIQHHAARFAEIESSMVSAADKRTAALEAELAQAHAEVADAKRQRDDLLAVIHRDGGHYTAEHGVEQSWADAIQKAARAVQGIEAAEAERDKYRATLSGLLDAFKTADDERLDETDKAHAEAAKWKAEGDMYGWNFHEGRSGGTVSASIIFYRVRRLLDAALAPQAEKPQ